VQKVNSQSKSGSPERLMWLLEGIHGGARTNRHVVQLGCHSPFLVGLFLVLALMFRATGCNRSSKAGTQSMYIVAESASFEARAKNDPLQWVQQGSLISQPVSSFRSKRRDRSAATGPDFPHRVRGPKRGLSWSIENT
jgi:hypothetical protein